MNDNNIVAEIAAIICHEVGKHVEALTVDTELEMIPGWDSISMSCIVIAIEQKFGFEFFGQQLDNLSTLGSLASLVDSKAALSRGSATVDSP